MSRTVLVTNLGPGPIKAEVQGRNSRGHFEQQAEYRIEENTFKSITLAETSSFQILPVPAANEPQPSSNNVV